MCGFCNVWVCVCGFVWVYVCVGVCMCGFCNVWVCVCVGFVCVWVNFVMCGCVCVGFVMCVCVCVGFVFGCVYVYVCVGVCG